jgi:hypothetical protein
MGMATGRATMAAALLGFTVMPPAHAQPLPTSAEMTFTLAGTGGNCAGCEWLAAEGMIAATTPKAFDRFQAQWNKDNPGTQLIVQFNSLGGDTFGAMTLGRKIRGAGFSTGVGQTLPDGQWQQVTGGRCLSACVLAFLGGRNRTYLPDAGAPRPAGTLAQLGFRDWRSDDAASLLGTEQSRLDALDLGVTISEIVPSAVVGYVVQMGVDPGFLALASAEQEKDGDRILSRDEAERYKVMTAAGAVTSWTLRVVRGGLILFGKGEGVYSDYTAALQCYPKQKNALLFQATVPYHLETGQTRQNVEADFNSSLVMQATDARGSGTPRNLGARPYAFVAGHLMASGIVSDAPLWMLKNEGLTIGYDGPHALEGVFPDIRLSQPIVSKAIAILLRNCPLP